MEMSLQARGDGCDGAMGWSEMVDVTVSAIGMRERGREWTVLELKGYMAGSGLWSVDAVGEGGRWDGRQEWAGWFLLVFLLLFLTSSVVV